MKLDLRKIYRFEAIDHRPGAALPVGGDIYYECADCGHVVSSVTHLPAACECGNVAGKQGKVEVRAPDKIKPVRGKLR
jgi:hypothetical protein